MVLKRCAYGSCSNDSSFANKEQMRGVVFIRFPNAKLNTNKCDRWVRACCRDDFAIGDVTEDTYICSKHFVGGNGPTVSHPDPIPRSSSENSCSNQLLVDNSSENLSKKRCKENEIDCSNLSKKLREDDANNQLISNSIECTGLISNVTIGNDIHVFECKNNESNKRKVNILTAKSISVSEDDAMNCDQKKNIFVQNNSISVEKDINCKSTDDTILNLSSSITSICDFTLKSSGSSESLRNYYSPSALKQSSKDIENVKIVDEGSVSIPLTTQSGTSCQLVLSKLQDSPNTNGLPILIKVLPSNTSTNILPTTAVAVIPVKAKKRWLDSINPCEFCFKWASLGLSVEFSNGNWVFTSINGSLAEKQLKLSPFGEYDVKVLGNSLLPDHSFFDGVPIDLNEERDFHCLMNQFGRWKVCAGNDNVEKVFEDTIIAVRAFVCNLTQTLRSKYCELLVSGNGPIRCKECKMLLNRIRRLKYQKRKGHEEKTFTDTSENEQSQHSTSDHEVPIIDNIGKLPLNAKKDGDVNPSLCPDDRVDEDTVPADYLCMKMVEYVSYT